jgi:hypothetical protein
MSVPEPEPQLPATDLEGSSITSAPPLYLLEKTPQEFVRFNLLLAVRDGFDRITLRQNDICYDMFGRYNGEEFGIIGPTIEIAQEFPAILASLGGVQPLKQRDGSESGEFVFPVGHDSVRGTYRVRWDKGMVAELEIDLPIVERTVAEAAGHDLRESARAREAAEALQPRELAEQTKPNLSATTSGKAALNAFAELAAFFKKDDSSK